MKTIVKEIPMFERKTITKEFNVFECSDIERALSKSVGEEVSITDVTCILTYLMSEKNGEPCGMELDFEVGVNHRDSIDLFWDSDAGEYYFEGKLLCLELPWLPPEDLFDFDISLFKSFNTVADIGCKI